MIKLCVVGNPISHSRSPELHQQLARQQGVTIQYTTVEAPLDGFAETIRRLQCEGFRGCNITVPFKEQAYALANEASEAAQAAKAANTFIFESHKIIADNTDGIGLVRDITINKKYSLKNKHIVIVGAGGAVRGILQPLLAENPQSLCIANRTFSKARQLASEFPGVKAIPFSSIRESVIDVLIDATSSDETVENLPVIHFSEESLAYDLKYGRETALMKFAKRCGAKQIVDGFGMLTEQAAAAFQSWLS